MSITSQVTAEALVARGKRTRGGHRPLDYAPPATAPRPIALPDPARAPEPPSLDAPDSTLARPVDPAGETEAPLRPARTRARPRSAAAERPLDLSLERSVMKGLKMRRTIRGALQQLADEAERAGWALPAARIAELAVLALVEMDPGEVRARIVRVPRRPNPECSGDDLLSRIAADQDRPVQFAFRLRGGLADALDTLGDEVRGRGAPISERRLIECAVVEAVLGGLDALLPLADRMPARR